MMILLTRHGFIESQKLLINTASLSYLAGRESRYFSPIVHHVNSTVILPVHQVNKRSLYSPTVHHVNPRILTHLDTLNYNLLRGMAKKAKSKSKGGKRTMDDIIDELGSDDDNDHIEETDEELLSTHKETPLSKFLDSPKSGKKSVKGSSITLKYSELIHIVNGEKIWNELDNCVGGLKDFYIHQLNIRSASSLDTLKVDLEGDEYPLNEIASISKKDPKRLTIDTSAFPQASQNIMKTIQESGLNLNPQQDGLKIFVPIPKVTKEFREKLASGARKKMNETKEELRTVQNRFIREASEMEGVKGISEDDVRAAIETIKGVTDNFMNTSDQMMQVKTKELMGK